MSWFNTSGPCPNYVLYSKVRYTRNIAKQNFPHLLDRKREEESISRLDTLLTSNGFRGETTVSGVTPAILSLAERQLIERDFVYSERRRALYLNDPCNLMIAIGGDDFVSISSVMPGLSVIEAKNMASEAEDMIDLEIAFAYSDQIGYLSSSPSRCGSCLTLSATLFLPSLKLTDSIEPLKGSLRLIGIDLAPTFINTCGDLYTLSYTPHYLCDEDAATVRFSDTISAIVEKEKSDLGMIYSGKGKIIYANARRALGSLLYCESMSEEEMLNALASIRLYHCICDDVKAGELPGISELNFLSAEGLNASIIATSKDTCGSMEECERMRAELFGRYIEHKSEVV